MWRSVICREPPGVTSAETKLRLNVLGPATGRVVWYFLRTSIALVPFVPILLCLSIKWNRACEFLHANEWDLIPLRS